MKIRLDYVTNSSSSSYLIAYKALPEFDEETISKYPILKYFGSFMEQALFASDDYETDAGEVYSTKDEYDEYFVDYYGYSDFDTVEKILADDEGLKDDYNYAIQWLEKGFKLLRKRVGYDNQYCMNLFEALSEDKDNFVILEDE